VKTALATLALALALVGCKSSDATPQPAPIASGSVGRISVHAPTLAAPPPGFEACHDGFESPSELKAAADAYETLRRKRPKLSLTAAKALARHQPSQLSIVAGRTLVVSLGSWAEEVSTTPAELEPFTSWKWEWSTYQELVTDGTLPLDALVAVVGEDGYRGFYARLYVLSHDATETARTLERDGRRILRTVVCGLRDDEFHRAAFRARSHTKDTPPGVQLTASISHGDHDELQTVEFRVIALDKPRSATLACFYSGDGNSANCKELAASLVAAATD
jgi:hypothetical protein